MLEELSRTHEVIHLKEAIGSPFLIPTACLRLVFHELAEANTPTTLSLPLSCVVFLLAW